MSKQLATRGTPAASWELFPDVPPMFDGGLMELWNNLLSARTSGLFVPGGDLRETERQYVLDIDLPGVEKKDIRIEVTGRRINVSGTRSANEGGGALRSSTRTSGSFAYNVSLPTAVNEKKIKAKLAGGVLHVELPKAQDDKATEIVIE
ncbi:MAG TPA: Hsp20/alpha crystallin family protein [Microlunatus sp.]